MLRQCSVDEWRRRACRVEGAVAVASAEPDLAGLRGLAIEICEAVDVRYALLASNATTLRPP